MDEAGSRGDWVEVSSGLVTSLLRQFFKKVSTRDVRGWDTVKTLKTSSTSSLNDHRPGFQSEWRQSIRELATLLAWYY